MTLATRYLRSPSPSARLVVDPTIELIQAGAAAGNRVSAAPLPFAGGVGEASVNPNVLASFVDPSAEPLPGLQERFVRDLDRGLSGRRVAVEREEPVSPIGIEGRLHGARVDLDRRELGERDPAARVRATFAERHEPEEELANGLPAGGLSGRVQVLGAGGKGPADAADLTVRLEREAPVVTPIVELRERVLDERQRARLFGDVGRDLGDERADRR